MKVAVIGAGAAGLVTAHELLAAGHEVAIFEQSNRLGGVWAFTEAIEDDLLGRRPSARIHSSLYAAMRVNLPRDLMAFHGFPFDEPVSPEGDARRYPHHSEVLAYLERFAEISGVSEYIRFGRQVRHVEPAGHWLVDGERFDAVAICNGHYSEPYLPHLPGFETFPGLALHSHNYRRAEIFAGRRVALLGSSVSGADLSREIGDVAQAIFFCGRAFRQAPPLASQRSRIKRCPPITRFQDSTIYLAGGERIEDVDAFLFCTGYRYAFPFLESTEPPPITVRHNWVQGLYRQLIACAQPTLALIGLPFRIVPFPLFQRQARWFARYLNGCFALPAQTERRLERAGEIRAWRASGVPQRHYHFLGDGQIDYLNRLAEQCDDAPVPNWFTRLWTAHNRHARRYPNDYRDRPLPSH